MKTKAVLTMMEEAKGILSKLRPEVCEKIKGLNLDDALYVTDMMKEYTDEQLQRASETMIEIFLSFRKLEEDDQRRMIHYVQDLAAGKNMPDREGKE